MSTKKNTKKKKALQGVEQSAAKEIAVAVLPKIVLGGVLIGGAFFLGRALLVSIGVIDSKEEKKRKAEQEKQTTNNSTALVNAFSPRFYKEKGAGAVLLTKESAERLANQIQNALGYWITNDNETAIYGVFRQLQHKTQVSFLADTYFRLFKDDLYNKLEDKLSDSELAIVNGIVNNLL